MEVVAAVGGALLSVSFEKLFDKLASPELRQFASKKKVRSQLHKWETDMLPKIHAVLEDAELKQTTSPRVEIWLNELRNLVYDVEDVLDEFSTEALRLKWKNSQQAAAATTSCHQVTKCVPVNYFTGFKFNAVMSSKLKEITTRLETICDEKSKLDLVVKAVGGERSGRSDDGTARLPTTSLSDSHVFGRDKDKKALLDLLLANEPTDAAATSGGGDAAVSVIPIQGMGGLGKTTLAQIVYNDEMVKRLFESRAWVCVSDTFHIPNITKAILQSVGGGSDDGMTFDQLQVKLGNILYGKKFLIVLDDVWNENYEAWTSLQKPFIRGAPGSKIVVTTRNVRVASIMGTCQPYSLGILSFDDCLSLFARHALGATNFDGHPDLKDIGEKILGKCNGLPLAAKTLGGLLRTKLRPCEWADILESSLWESNIFPALSLSYQHLPSQLKQCFAYCATFPKDYEFDMNELVMLWMAEGFLPHQKREKHLQDVGVELFGYLLSRSFFQYSSKDCTRFVMHDIIHDLAQHVDGEICFHLDVQLERLEHPFTLRKARHFSFLRCSHVVSRRFEVFDGVKCLRTLLALPVLASDDYNWISDDVLNRLLSTLKHLRTLSLTAFRIRRVPESVHGLKHLRYLNLSKTAIRLLPEFVGSLLNLQTLLLRECKELEKLPTSIVNLPDLCHLDIRGTKQLKQMPAGIGNLTGLRSLAKFIVGLEEVGGLNIRELEHLSHLEGEISIQGLHNVENLEDARNADLKGKKGLETLVMEWNQNLYDPISNESVAVNVLELLQPHTDLKGLTIRFYCGREFPSWLGDPSLMSNIVEIELYMCWKSTSLPSLGRLPVLKHLTVKGMKAMKLVGFEFHGCSFPFPALETLKFEDMLGWEEWNSSGIGAEVKFPHLRELEILNCPLLVGEWPVSFPSLCKLKLEKCNESLLRCVIDLTSLTALRIGNLSGLSCLHESFMQLVVLEDLEIYECEDLTSLWASGAHFEENLTCLRSLKVRSCVQLVSFSTDTTSGEEEMPRNLAYLEVEDCVQLQKLPMKMASLEKMIVRKCPNVGSVQFDYPRKLRHVELDDCGGWLTGSLVNGMVTNGNDCVLEHLEIRSCDSLQHLGITRGGNVVLARLRHLRIEDCTNMVSLSNSDEVMTTTQQEQGDTICGLDIGEMEELEIKNCPSLTTEGAKLPIAAKKLTLTNCSKLESLPKGYISRVVEEIKIWDCPNLKSLPNFLHRLKHLTSLWLYQCDGLECFPELGLPIPNLRILRIDHCKNLKSLPNNMHSLMSLQELHVEECPHLISFPRHLPPNLIVLDVKNCSNMMEPMSEWGLHYLTSLQQLWIAGFSRVPSRLMLPATLTSLSISTMKNLESISLWGIQDLMSLTKLYLWYCPKLQHLPEEGLPPTLELLWIRRCPILASKCTEGKGKYWRAISLIPQIDIA